MAKPDSADKYLHDLRGKKVTFTVITGETLAYEIEEVREHTLLVKAGETRTLLFKHAIVRIEWTPEET